MDKLHHDFETFSKIDLKKHGLARYARDKSTEVLFLWYAFNDEEPEVWFPATEPMPKTESRKLSTTLPLTALTAGIFGPQKPR